MSGIEGVRSGECHIIKNLPGKTNEKTEANCETDLGIHGSGRAWVSLSPMPALGYLRWRCDFPWVAWDSVGSVFLETAGATSRGDGFFPRWSTVSCAVPFSWWSFKEPNALGYTV